jgi:hypothetical protein
VAGITRAHADLRDRLLDVQALADEIRIEVERDERAAAQAAVLAALERAGQAHERLLQAHDEWRFALRVAQREIERLGRSPQPMRVA